jgi:two-component system phosphate regulon sensor histidine kinase PhoR
MFYRSGVLALMLSGGIALVTTLLLSIFGSLGGNSVTLAFITTYTICFAVIFFVLESFVVKPMKNIRETIGRLYVKEGVEDEGPPLASLEKVSEEMERFASHKQKEIDELRKQEAFRKDFIADVSHELKTPIFAAQGFVHTLLDGAVKDKSVRQKFLRKAAKSLDGLDVLVQDLLTLSQIETGQIKMRVEKFDLCALTKEVFEQFRGKSNKKEISLRIEEPVRKVMVHADWQRISQVMTNLISNAIKHSAPDGEVVVTFSMRKKSVVTRVRDFGEGIPPEHLNRIFERFYRVDKSRSREKGGTGLGLAIVKHILEGHNTRAEVESQPGKGSTFSFKLPRAGVEKDGYGENQQSAEE